jgi:hypothetical protein
MNVTEFKRQLEQAIEDCGLTAEDEIILDIEDDYFGVSQVACESGRVLIVAGDPADEDL